MTILQHSIAQAAAAASGYQIARSLRFNRADSAYMSRTLTANGNRQLWTFSGWIKRSGLGTQQTIFATSASSTTDWAQLVINSSDQVEYIEYSTVDTARRITTQVLRDVSAWYHIVCVWDSSNATANNRILLYINGQAVTAFSTTINPSSGASSYINSTSYNPLNIGRLVFSNAGTNHFDGYISNIHFIDGQALTPSSFGETDSATGVWVPKAYTGTYGTNGFWLKLDDNSNTTAATLGKDSSGNSNNWTPNNFSVTAGVGNDSLVDSPTNYGTDTGAGGEVRGNYATWNPLYTNTAFGTGTYTNGNLDFTIVNGGSLTTTMSVRSGKWYSEHVCTANLAGWSVGVRQVNTTDRSTSVIQYDPTGTKSISGTTTAYGSSFAIGDVIGIALDMDGGTVTFYKNNVSQGAIALSLASITEAVVSAHGGGGVTGQGYSNFGQRPFAYTAPSGFKALCTTNLPTPAIGASASTLASKNFDATTYSGNSSTQSIVNAGGFQPDFVWAKARSTTYSHRLWDAVRGTTKYLNTDNTLVEATDAAGVTAFNSNGFSVGNSFDNTSGQTYVAWQWKAGNGTVSNTAGSITSTVSANAAAGISIATYTGNGSASQTIGHGLGAVPKMVIIKGRSNAFGWGVQHVGLTGGNNYLALNQTAAQATDNTQGAITNATSTTLQVSGSSGASSWANASGQTYVAYAFAEVPGFSKFGSYTGNGSSDGTFVYCGFRPRWILIKKSSAAGDAWWMLDTARSQYNVSKERLTPTTSGAEDATYSIFDILSNGFKLRDVDTSWNASGATFIFAAFAEAPFNYSRAR